MNAVDMTPKVITIKRIIVEPEAPGAEQSDVERDAEIVVRRFINGKPAAEMLPCPVVAPIASKP